MKRLAVLMFSVLASSTSFAQMVTANVVVDQTGRSLSVTGSPYQAASGRYYIKGIKVIDGRRSVTIDSRSENQALVQVAQALCFNLGKSIDPTAFAVQGYVATSTGQVVLKAVQNQVVAVTARDADDLENNQVHSFICE